MHWPPIHHAPRRLQLTRCTELLCRISFLTSSHSWSSLPPIICLVVSSTINRPDLEATLLSFIGVSVLLLSANLSCVPSQGELGRFDRESLCPFVPNDPSKSSAS